MKNEHILELIENMPLSEISESELVRIRTHATECASCKKAFVAAQISTALLKERTAEVFEPTSFFQTRVLAALRERQNANDWSWARMWRATGVLASSMLASVVAIAVLTFVAPATQTDSDVSLAGNTYSAEAMVLDQTDSVDDQVTDAQVLNTLYESDEEK